jgi:hypothetical protein
MQAREKTAPKCCFKDCGKYATKRLTVAVGGKPMPAKLEVCEQHLFEMTDHGFKLSVRLDENGGVEVWRPSW